MTKSILFYQLLLLAFIGCNNTQPDGPNVQLKYYEKCLQIVLSENTPNKEFFFKILQKDKYEFKLSYLGSIKTSNGKSLKFANAIFYYGLYDDAMHAKNYIIVFGSRNEEIGHYFLGGEYGIPVKLQGSNLVFSNYDDDCSQTTLISFKDSIPKHIFINCTKGWGDLYSFTDY